MRGNIFSKGKVSKINYRKLNLKTCPFCGSKAKLFDDKKLNVSIVCQDDNLLCNARIIHCRSVEEAIWAWNQRVEDSVGQQVKNYTLAE